MIFNTPPIDFHARFEVVGCYIEVGGELLFLHRQDHKPEGNTWCVHGGKVDVGESHLEAIIREAGQETSIALDPTQAKHIKKVYVRYAAYDFVYHLFRIVLSEKPEVRVKKDEHKAYCWASLQNALVMPLIEDEDTCLKMIYAV